MCEGGTGKDSRRVGTERSLSCLERRGKEVGERGGEPHSDMARSEQSAVEEDLRSALPLKTHNRLVRLRYASSHAPLPSFPSPSSLPFPYLYSEISTSSPQFCQGSLMPGLFSLSPPVL